jgi:hypothetical protein
MKKLIYSILIVAGLAAGGSAFAQGEGDNSNSGPSFGPPARSPEAQGNSGWTPPPDYRHGNRAYGPTREEVQRERDLAERRHRDALANQQRERERDRLAAEQRAQRERQLAEERRRRDIAEAQRDRDRARMGHTRERDRDRDRDGDGVNNRRDRFPDNPGRS